MSPADLCLLLLCLPSAERMVRVRATTLTPVSAVVVAAAVVTTMKGATVTATLTMEARTTTTTTNQLLLVSVTLRVVSLLQG